MPRYGRIAIVAGVAFIIFLQLLFLTPSDLESEAGDSVDVETLMINTQETLAPGIPKDRVPEYTIDRFRYFSSQGSQKLWQLTAVRAYVYNANHVVHSRNVIALLYDAEGKTTRITGKESKFGLNARDFEVFGNAVAVFPDGFIVRADYMRYLAAEQRVIIPDHYPVSGGDPPIPGRPAPSEAQPSPTPTPIPTPSPSAIAMVEEAPPQPILAASPVPVASPRPPDQRLTFESMGLEFSLKTYDVLLPKSVVMYYERVTEQTELSSGVPDKTIIKSDRCAIDRRKQVSVFTMDPARPPKERFVLITQPDLYCRSRQARLNYGEFSDILQYLVAQQDVYVEELGDKSYERYGTGGRADFDSRRNVIVMKEFPQVYQNQDTITGDVIIVHRDTDLVEVEQSNAYSQGNE